MYAESRQWYRLYGMTMSNVPETLDDFDAYWEHYVEHVLEPTPFSGWLLRAFRNPPPPPGLTWMPRPLWRPLSRIGRPGRGRDRHRAAARAGPPRARPALDPAAPRRGCAAPAYPPHAQQPAPPPPSLPSSPAGRLAARGAGAEHHRGGAAPVTGLRAAAASAGSARPARRRHQLQPALRPARPGCARSPAPARCRERRGSGPGRPRWNRSKTRSRSAVGYAGSVVHHVEDDLPVGDRRARSSTRDPACVTALSSRLRTTRRSSLGLARTGPAETCAVSMTVAAGVPRPGRLLEDHCVEVDGGRHRGRALVGRGEDEQVVDEALPSRRSRPGPRRAAPRGRRRPARTAPAPARPAAPRAGPAGRGRRRRPAAAAAARTRRRARASGSWSRRAGRPRRADRRRAPGVRAGRGRSRRPRPGSGPAGPAPGPAPATSPGRAPPRPAGHRPPGCAAASRWPRAPTPGSTRRPRSPRRRAGARSGPRPGRSRSRRRPGARIVRRSPSAPRRRRRSAPRPSMFGGRREHRAVRGDHLGHARRRSRCAAPSGSSPAAAWSSRSRTRDRDRSSLLSVRCLSSVRARAGRRRRPAPPRTAAWPPPWPGRAAVSAAISAVRHQPVADQPHGLQAGAAER